MNERIEEGLKGMDLKNQILQPQPKKKKLLVEYSQSLLSPTSDIKTN